MLVAISRTVDYRHHWQDVTVGAIIGIGLACFSYRQYYPPLWSENSAEPFAPRVDMDFAPTRRDFPRRQDFVVTNESNNSLLEGEEATSHYNLSQQSPAFDDSHQPRRDDMPKGASLV
jgi:hypothetical protein